MKNNGKIIIFYILLIVGTLVLSTALLGPAEGKKMQYSEVVELFQNEKVDSFVVKNDNTLMLSTKDGEDLRFKLRDLSIFERDLKDLILEQKKDGIITEFHYEEPVDFPWWVSFLPYTARGRYLWIWI